LEQYNISDKVEIILEKSQIIIRPKTEVRKNWEDAFMQMNQNGDDQLLMDDVFEEETFD
jgi:antitoxin MazE